MALMDGKVALIFGVANKNSIAWGIAEALHREGAEIALSYGQERLEHRIKPLADSTGAKLVEMCDVTDDAAINSIFEKVKETYGKLDVLVHSVAFAEAAEMERGYIDTRREGFSLAMDISVYSLVALARAARPLMGAGSSILTLSYYGADKVAPNYNVMGVAKAALEASVRYLAFDVGPQGIRVNAISAGPIKTLAASGVREIRKMLNYAPLVAPLRDMVDQDQVGDTALWLSSDLARGVTGQVVFVDAGLSIMPAFPADMLDDYEG